MQKLFARINIIKRITFFLFFFLEETDPRGQMSGEHFQSTVLSGVYVKRQLSKDI